MESERRRIGEVLRSIQLWESVFELGPRGHYSIGQFLSNWFYELKETTDTNLFAQRWRPMIEYMFANKNWTSGRQWYHGQLERQALGFGAETYIKRAPNYVALIGGMKDLYKAWAERRLTRNEDNLAGLCGFLSSEAGRAIRLDGLIWIAEATQNDADAGRWHRDTTSDAFMAFLNTLVSEDAEQIAKDEKARQALLELIAHAVTRQLPAALALQERARIAL